MRDKHGLRKKTAQLKTITGRNKPDGILVVRLELDDVGERVEGHVPVGSRQVAGLKGRQVWEGALGSVVDRPSESGKKLNLKNERENSWQGI